MPPKKRFSKSARLKSISNKMPLVCSIIFRGLFLVALGASEIRFVSAQIKSTNASSSSVNKPKISKTAGKIKPRPDAAPAKTIDLDHREAIKFYNSYEDALGADSLDFRAAYDKFFVAEPRARQFLGRQALPSGLNVCQNSDANKCEKIIAEKIAGSDLEKYYFLRMEKEHFVKLFWLYAEVFDVAARRGLYKLLETEDFNGLQVVLDPELLNEAAGREKTEKPYNIAEEIERVENFNRKLKKHFRQLSENHSFVKKILEEMRVEARSADKIENEKTLVSAKYFSDCREKICSAWNTYFEVENLQVYREPGSGQLRAFGVFFRLKLF